jgi:GT2 family glycosyltransferase
MLGACVDSILEKTDYPNYEILIVDNRSRCGKTLDLLVRYGEDPRIRVLRYADEFNFSAICNWAVKRQAGAVTGLVNNDVEVINPEWMTEMVSQCCRPEIGCVGAKLRYGDDTIQHAGIILGLGGTAGHAHHRAPANVAGYGMRLATVNNVAAVTAACLFVRRTVYEQVGGMDERNLAIAYNDVDFCLEVLNAGYRNVFTPYAELYHYESQSRGLEDTRAKKRRLAREADFVNNKWGEWIKCDPYYNANLATAPPMASYDLKPEI